ncbi:Uncharacterised protein [Serratia ficaria]|uniref:hypothetical protein n=1 Tax=Serratia ficaria TaxID=61651 RepID=UPI002182A91D|nr:hypothetical protein [Serratia ficaria]CAI2516120.1 Uncharacterised protein [Serratia ficaria]
MTTTPLLSDAAIIEDLISTLTKYGWNVDRRSLSPVMAMILTQHKAHQKVAEMCRYYLEEPERLLIEQAFENRKEQDNE